jgi:hypothetical protein
MTTTTTNQPTQAQWDAANRFLDRLLIDPILANGYQQISQQANGQDNAPEILTTWLQQQGYDTTPELVYSALIALQNTSLAYWTGIYGQSFLGSSEPAPVLAIGPDAEGNTVAYLDGVELKNFVFQSVETENAFHPTLSWDLESNQTAGNITFFYTSAVTLDPNPPTGYTGNWFEGTLQTSVSSSFQRYYGAIGKPADPSVMSQLILASGKEQSWWDKYSTDVYIGIGTLGFIVAFVCIGVLVYRRYRVPERDFEEQEPKKLAKEWEKEWNKKHKDVEKTPNYKVLMEAVKKKCGNQKISENQCWEFFVEEKLKEKPDVINVLDLGRLDGVGPRYDLTQARQSDSNLRDSTEERKILKKISDLTKIPVEKISPLLPILNEAPPDTLLRFKGWNSLIDQGLTENYLNAPRPNDPKFKGWLVQVKEELLQAQATFTQRELEISSSNSDLQQFQQIEKQSQQFPYIEESQEVPVEFQSQRITGPSLQPALVQSNCWTENLT